MMSGYPVNGSYVNPGNYCQNGGCDFNMDSIYDKLREDDFQNILIITILLGILSCVGSFGNLCVLIVFSLRFQQRTSTYFILSLAAIDFIICVFVIPGLIVKTWYHQFYFDWLCKLWEMFRMYSLPTSAILLVAIASDRYFLICMATNKIMTKRRAKLIIFTIALLGLGLSIPPLLAVGVYEIDDDGSQMYRGICIENYWLISVQGLHSYWIFVTTLFCVMMLLIAILYTRIFMTVYRQDHRWRRSNHHSKIVPVTRNTMNATDQTQTIEFQKTEMDSVGLPVGKRKLQTKPKTVKGTGTDCTVDIDDSKTPGTDRIVTGEREVHLMNDTNPHPAKLNSWMTDRKQSDTKVSDGKNSQSYQRQSYQSKSMCDATQNVTQDPMDSQSLQPNKDFRADSYTSRQCEETNQSITQWASPSGSHLTMGPSSLPETPPSTPAAHSFQAVLTPAFTCESSHTRLMLSGVSAHKSTNSPKGTHPGPKTKTSIPDCLQCSKKQWSQNPQCDNNGYLLYPHCTCSIQASGSANNKLHVPDLTSVPCSRLEGFFKNSCSVCHDLQEQRSYLPGSSTMDNEITCSCISSAGFPRSSYSLCGLPYQQAGSSTRLTEFNEGQSLKSSVNEHGYNGEAITALSVENLTDLSDHSIGLVNYPNTGLDTPEDLQTKTPPSQASHSDTNKPHSSRSPCQHSAHIKMARVVFTVTLVYIVSFLPTFLVSYQVIENEAVFYVYFINNAANPIIYSFMNRKFRAEVKALLKGFFSKLTNHFSQKN